MEYIFANSNVLQNFFADIKNQNLIKYISDNTHLVLEYASDVATINTEIWHDIYHNKTINCSVDELLIVIKALHKFNVEPYYSNVLHNLVHRIITSYNDINLEPLKELCDDIKYDLITIDEYKSGIISYILGYDSVLWINDFIFTTKLLNTGIQNDYTVTHKDKSLINTKILLKCGINMIMHMIENHNTPINEIIKSTIQNEDIVMLCLIENHIGVNIKKKYKNEICLYAVMYNNIFVLKWLHDLGYAIEFNIFLEAIQRNNVEVIMWGLPLLEINEIKYLEKIALRQGSTNILNILKQNHVKHKNFNKVIQ